MKWSLIIGLSCIVRKEGNDMIPDVNIQFSKQKQNLLFHMDWRVEKDDCVSCPFGHTREINLDTVQRIAKCTS